MAVWADFYPNLMPHVTGCPVPAANNALRDSAQEFLRRTRIWREWLDPLVVHEGNREYSLDTPRGAVVVRVERCTSNGQPLDVISHNALPSDYAYTEQERSGIVSRDRADFRLTRSMPAGAVISVEVSLAPSDAAEGIPNDLFNQHREDIVFGAKHRLMLLPKAEFFNPDLAMVAKAEFESCIASKTVSAWRGSTGVIPRPRVRWV